jgi:hypothetical protein
VPMVDTATGRITNGAAVATHRVLLGVLRVPVVDPRHPPLRIPRVRRVGNSRAAPSPALPRCNCTYTSTEPLGVRGEVRQLQCARIHIRAP